MNKLICDICGVNEADKYFKVHQLKAYAEYDFGTVFPFFKWTKVDVCQSCYEKLVGSKGGKRDGAV